MIANHSFVFESINFLNYTGSFFMNYQKLNTDKMEGLPFRGDNMEDLFRVITCAVIENSGV